MLNCDTQTKTFTDTRDGRIIDLDEDPNPKRAMLSLFEVNETQLQKSYTGAASKRGLINDQISCIKYDITYCVPFFQGRLLRRFRKQDITFK